MRYGGDIDRSLDPLRLPWLDFVNDAAARARRLPFARRDMKGGI